MSCAPEGILMADQSTVDSAGAAAGRDTERCTSWLHRAVWWGEPVAVARPLLPAGKAQPSPPSTLGGLLGPGVPIQDR